MQGASALSVDGVHAVRCGMKLPQVLQSSRRSAIGKHSVSRCGAKLHLRSRRSEGFSLGRAASNYSARSVMVKAASDESDTEVKKQDFVQNTQFGYSRKDVIIIGGAVTAAGFALYYGLQAAGYDMVAAGDIVLVVITLGMTIAWTASYVFRVANKDMTYVKQLKDYEEAVMQKRLEELPEAELAKLLEEVEKESANIK